MGIPINKNIVQEIRKDYINGLRFSDLLSKYSISERSLAGILANKRHFDPNYIKPESNRLLRNTNDFLEKSILIHKNKYDYSKVEYINANTDVCIICPIHGEFYQNPYIHKNGSECKLCSFIKLGDSKRFTNENIDSYLIDKKINIKRIGNYISDRAKIEFLCLICTYSWETAPSHIKQGTRCPNCANSFCNNEKIDNCILECIFNIKRLDNYIDSFTKMNWECTICNKTWKTTASAIMDGSGCPHCYMERKLVNENRVQTFLDKLNIKYEKKIIKIDNKKYYPDFFIPSLNLIIEYNGAQHYEPVTFGSRSIEQAQEKLIKQQLRDANIREYCKENKINLLEIDGRKYHGRKLIDFLKQYFG